MTCRASSSGLDAPRRSAAIRRSFFMMRTPRRLLDRVRDFARRVEEIDAWGAEGIDDETKAGLSVRIGEIEHRVLLRVAADEHALGKGRHAVRVRRDPV